MKKLIPLFAVAAIVVAGIMIQPKIKAAEGGAFQKHEFVTIRWAGKENTHLIRSNGKVEMLGSVLNRISRPDRTDERAFYMNVAMNAVAVEGYEFAGMNSDEIVMKREIK